MLKERCLSAKASGHTILLFFVSLAILVFLGGCTWLVDWLSPVPKETFTISGGILSEDSLFVDDDIIVKVDGTVVFADEDGYYTGDSRGATYSGEPIRFNASPNSTLKIIAIDVCCCRAELSQLYLHRADGYIAKVTDEINAQSQGTCSPGNPNPDCVAVFFEDEYKLEELRFVPPPIKATVTGPTDDGVNDGINDGDTVDLDGEVLGKTRIRYTGIDTPEITPGVECFANEATERNRQLVGNKTVWIELDERTVGGQGRLLAYVHTSPDLALDSMVNYKLLLEGYAKIFKVEENWRYVDAFRDAQLNAVFARQGMWGEGSCGDNPNADVVIAAIQYWSDDEFVVILNRGNNDVNLAGWTLSDEAGHTFTFSGDYDLQAWSPIIGLSLSTRVIHSGPGTNQPLDNDVNWTDDLIWDDAPGDKAFLRNAGGELIHSYEYKGF